MGSLHVLLQREASSPGKNGPQHEAITDHYAGYFKYRTGFRIGRSAEASQSGIRMFSNIVDNLRNEEKGRLSFVPKNFGACAPQLQPEFTPERRRLTQLILEHHGIY